MIEIITNLYILILPKLFETLYMVFFSTLCSVILGLPLGVILVISEEGHIWGHKKINGALGYIINILRSIPFIILIIAISPLARLIVGTAIGSTAAIVSLSLAATPFVARVVEGALKEVSWGIIEASLAMGATTKDIIFNVLIPEAMPALVLGLTLTIINVIGYSAMAGAIGAGGLGDLAIRYGYQRFRTDVLIGTIVILVILVQIIQSLGNRIAGKLDKR